MASIKTYPLILPSVLRAGRTIDDAVAQHRKRTEEVHIPDSYPSGMKLLLEIKSGKLRNGPTPDLTLSQTTDRGLRDKIILVGLQSLLDDETFGVFEYQVDWEAFTRAPEITGAVGGLTLNGTAFYESPKRFAEVMADAQADLDVAGADIQLIMANADGIESDYRPTIAPDQFLLLVNVFSGEVQGHAGPGLLPADQ